MLTKISLNDKIELCYINSKDLFEWIKNNNLLISSFNKEKEKWKEEVNKEANFFSDTELLLEHKNLILLKVANGSHVSFLFKTYKLKYQAICQKIFQEKKNLIIISNRQWKEQKNDEKFIVLFKDENSIKKSLENWSKLLVESQ